MDTRKARKCSIRYMIRRDLAYVCEVDDKYSEDELITILAKHDTEGYVIEISEQIVGYCIFSHHGDSIKIRHIFTRADFRRSGLASQIIQKLAARLRSTFLNPATRRQIVAMVPETDLDSLLFLRSCGFKGKLVKKGGGYDYIKMVLKNDV